MLVVPRPPSLPAMPTLSDGMSGIPRQVMNGEPNSVTVGGGTPRRVHSRPNAAMARGCARKNAGSFQTRVINSSRSSGVGAPARVATRDDLLALLQQAVVGVVDELVLLPLLQHLDQDAELLAHLVHRAAIEIGDPRLDVDGRGDGAERVLARLLFVVDEGRRQLVAVAGLQASAIPESVASLTLFTR